MARRVGVLTKKGPGELAVTHRGAIADAGSLSRLRVVGARCPSSVPSLLFNPQNEIHPGWRPAERTQMRRALGSMPLGVKAYLQNCLQDRNVDSQSRGTGLQFAFEVRIARIGKPLGFEPFGLVESIEDIGEILGDLHFVFAIEGMTENVEEPEAIGKQDVVEDLVKFPVVSGGGMLLDGAQQVGVGPPFVPDQFVNHR
jgi:hypothetical protein